MKTLLRGTAANKIFTGDCMSGRLSHAYMLYFEDSANLREALKLFALAFFGAKEGDREERLIAQEGLPDLKIYPQAGKKLTAEVAAAIVEDAALRPLEYDRKLYIISDFESASPIFQNKLLKILEEPPQGVYFLLGAASLSSVLDTIISRVKMLEIAPFSEGEIYGALTRRGDNPLNASAAAACGGVLGVAQNMLSGTWYREVRAAAEEICAADTVSAAAKAASVYGDFKYKKELLSEMQRIYFGEVKKYSSDDNYRGVLSLEAAIYAVEGVNRALAELKFNANFSALLCDLTLRVADRNDR